MDMLAEHLSQHPLITPEIILRSGSKTELTISFTVLASYIEKILSHPLHLPAPHFEGSSREGSPIAAYHFGSGAFKISLIAGCHADEPTGPRLLRHLVSYLSQQESSHPLLQGYSWWIVPHANPDGEVANRGWYTESDNHYSLPRYLQYAVRELPGDDMEYGFPIEGRTGPLRPENAFIYELWKKAGLPFHLHASLHSMATSFGPWFLIDPAWVGRSDILQEQCRKKTKELGYLLNDIDRSGEKGFHRISEGFCTRPNSEAMKAYFLERDDPKTAALFHPSSMESIRSLGGDCLTLVSEMPFFTIPNASQSMAWPNPDYGRWQRLMANWKMELLTGKKREEVVLQEAHHLGLRSMAVEDQMRLQWELVAAGVRQVENRRFAKS